MFQWTINRKDQKGAEWTLSGHSFPDTATFEVAAGKAGHAGHRRAGAGRAHGDAQAERKSASALSFVGHQKESIQMLRGNERPAGPKLTLANAAGSLVRHRHVRVWVRRRLLALMAGAKKCAASVDRNRENRQPLTRCRASPLTLEPKK